MPNLGLTHETSNGNFKVGFEPWLYLWLALSCLILPFLLCHLVGVFLEGAWE